MAAKKSVSNATVRSEQSGGIELYFKRIFTLMFGALGITAIATWLTLYAGGIHLLIDFAAGKMTPLYYITIFGAFGLAIWAQARAFSLKPSIAAILLAIYSALIGFGMTPLIFISLNVNPLAILQAFIIAALMFACMALFGYKTAKDLSFLGIFLFLGMIGLILVGIISMIWPLGSTFAAIVCLIGVLVFALFTAYDMQFLKRAYAAGGDEHHKNQLAVLGALHLYISFIAMFQYILSLLNRR
jgi:FtsH-binding integral membrane protein